MAEVRHRTPLVQSHCAHHVREVALLLSFLGTLLQSLAAGSAHPPVADLYAQATQNRLDHDFPSSRVEFLLLDIPTGQSVAFRWHNPQAAVPPGSLLKPFVALAYSELHSGSSHQAAFPTIQCHGRRDGCWHPAGHGSLTLEPALAVSCNAYFLALGRALSAAGSVGTAALLQVSATYGLPAPPNSEPESLIGITPEWSIPPLTLARAYARLSAQTQSSPEAPDPAPVSQLLAGLRLAAQPGGTASRVTPQVGRVLAKTGTAPCVSTPDFRCVANGDGLAILIFPADAPRLLLLVRQRGTTGAQTAELAGRMLTRIEAANAAPASR